MLHPGIGCDDPHGGEGGREGDQTHHDGMCLGGYFFPPEDPYTDQCGFQKKGSRCLDGQQRTENISHISGIAGPVGAELELQGNPRHDAEGKIDEKNLSPELGHSQVDFIPGLHITGFHPGQQNRQAQRQWNKQIMKHGCCSELQA